MLFDFIYIRKQSYIYIHYLQMQMRSRATVPPPEKVAPLELNQPMASLVFDSSCLGEIGGPTRLMTSEQGQTPLNTQTHISTPMPEAANNPTPTLRTLLTALQVLMASGRSKCSLRPIVPSARASGWTLLFVCDS